MSEGGESSTKCPLCRSRHTDVKHESDYSRDIVNVVNKLERDDWKVNLDHGMDDDEKQFNGAEQDKVIIEELLDLQNQFGLVLLKTEMRKFIDFGDWVLLLAAVGVSHETFSTFVRRWRENGLSDVDTLDCLTKAVCITRMQDHTKLPEGNDVIPLERSIGCCIATLIAVNQERVKVKKEDIADLHNSLAKDCSIQTS
jgi:hypothetical protein